ncbi:B3/4 domain-containing protein [uncultured Sporomusa sp.]|uniref:B3/4 domain-containing protein n=1 Tax=uncultured Sporomusa sp. TaxID=307249 RepID=A0A212LTX4_9FIRM|nr:phenylalanine--tRNA ligase beta subunit-related protein [uncultured Sporomusa sp.]SCM81035.1 B3/4 domain-containing protein [uncultured Sporomusa sp.]
MDFIVSKEVYEKLNTVYFGVVVAKGLNNQGVNYEVEQLLSESVDFIKSKFQTGKIKEALELSPYREAFTRLGINPNKYMSSIEAMGSRIIKSGSFPKINPLVDLGNAISLKYLVPLGAHDLDAANGDIQLRMSKTGDTFVPFGSEETELLTPGECIYSAGEVVKTRRWIWRQSEHGKVTDKTRNVFFPIDGFQDQNYKSIIAARDELAEQLHRIFSCEVKVGIVDRDNQSFKLN